MSKFKVGDKVRSTEHSWNDGLIGEVLRIDADGDLVVCFGDAYRSDGWHDDPTDRDGCWYMDGNNVEAVSETPKVGSKFYVYWVDPTDAFSSLEEAKEAASRYSKNNGGSTYGVFTPVTAFALPAEPQEVTLA